jgi:hypothetical protein
MKQGKRKVASVLNSALRQELISCSRSMTTIPNLGTDGNNWSVSRHGCIAPGKKPLVPTGLGGWIDPRAIRTLCSREISTAIAENQTLIPRSSSM